MWFNGQNGNHVTLFFTENLTFVTQRSEVTLIFLSVFERVCCHCMVANASKGDTPPHFSAGEEPGYEATRSPLFPFTPTW